MACNEFTVAGEGEITKTSFQMLCKGGVHPRSRKLFSSTLTELKAIAAAAIQGVSSRWNTGYSNPAASGIPTTLYPAAQPKFCRITETVARERAIAVHIPTGSLLNNS